LTLAHDGRATVTMERSKTMQRHHLVWFYRDA